MLGPSHSARRPRHLVSTVTLLALLTLSGCSSDEGPTATQAGQTLKTHILQLLKESNAQNVKITDPGGKNIPCEEGKAKQTFAATGNDVASETTPYILRTMMLGAMNHVGNYRIADISRPNDPVRIVDESKKTILLLDSPANGVYKITGETECLPAS